MKNLLKFAAFAMLFAMGTFVTSCGSDDDDSYCYECEAFDDGMGSSGDAFSICEGDDDGAGGTLSQDDVDLVVALHEGFGGTCSKK